MIRLINPAYNQPAEHQNISGFARRNKVDSAKSCSKQKIKIKIHNSFS